MEREKREFRETAKGNKILEGSTETLWGATSKFSKLSTIFFECAFKKKSGYVHCESYL